MCTNEKEAVLETSASCNIHEPELVEEILRKYNDIVVPEAPRSYFRNNFMLSKRSMQRSITPERIPDRTKLSNMISEIITSDASKELQSIYRSIKNLKNKQKFEPRKLSKHSVFADPRTLEKTFDGMSKGKRNYRKAYLNALVNRSTDLGEAKPIESKYCVNNYLYSQISVSGLASRKFNSVKARRRVQLLPTTTTDDKNYPASPRLEQTTSMTKPQSSASQRKPQLTKHHRRFSTEQDYENTFVLDSLTPLDQFLSNYHKLKSKKKRVYKTRMEDIDSITDLAREQGLENIDFYESVIIRAKNRCYTKA